MSKLSFGNRKFVLPIKFLLGAISVGMTGCLVGPNYARPEVILPSGWSGGGDNSIAVNTIAKWWDGFNDHQLSKLVEQAIENNLDRKVALLRLREARANRAIVRGDFYPNISANTGYRRSFSATASNQTQSGELEQEFQRGSGVIRSLYQAGFDASWELDIFGGLKRSVEVADAGVDFTKEELRDVTISLVAEVATAYCSLRGSQRQLDVADKNLQLQRKTAEIVKTRFDGGLASVLDVARAEAQVATTLAVLPQIQAEIDRDKLTIAVLLGLEPTALVDELEAVSDPVPVVAFPQTGLPSALLERRPDIRAAEANLKAANARIGVATADLFPRFSLTGAFGFESEPGDTLFNSGNRYWSFSPGVNLPIFAGGKLLANLDVQNVSYETTLVQYEQTILNALKEVEVLLGNLRNENDHYAALNAAVQLHRRAVSLARELYVEGLTDLLSVITEERSLFVVEDSFTRSETDLSNGIIALYKALGGGWEEIEKGSEKTSN